MDWQDLSRALWTFDGKPVVIDVLLAGERMATVHATLRAPTLRPPTTDPDSPGITYQLVPLVLGGEPFEEYPWTSHPSSYGVTPTLARSR